MKMNIVTPIVFKIIIMISYSKEVNIGNLIAFDYHGKVGIPEAARIKKLEDNIMNRNNQRIVGGSYASISEVPYQAGLLINVTRPEAESYTSLCGGSLIASNFVITAAHCTYDGVSSGEAFTVILGSDYLFYGGTRLSSNDFIVHPRWDVTTVANDIALVRFSPVLFTSVIQPIDLPTATEVTENFAYQTGITSGYGIIRDDDAVNREQRLSWVHVQIITNEECQLYYGPFLYETNICTDGKGGTSPCHGDSGGPLAVVRNGRKTLVAIVSFGSVEGCSAEIPAAYTRIIPYLPWIGTLQL